MRDRSAVRTFAELGAVLCVASLFMPWYVLRAHGLTGQGMSGGRALGSALTLVVVGRAAVAIWPRAARMHRLLPIGAAVALSGLITVRVVSHPKAVDALPVRGSSDAFTSQLERALAQSVVDAVQLRWAPTWGLWVAAVGAALLVAGTLGGVHEARQPHASTSAVL